MPFVRGTKEAVVMDFVKTAGVIALSLVTPGIANTFLKKKKPLSRGGRQYLQKVTVRLIDRGLLTVTKDKQIKLTEKGEQWLLMREEMELPKHRWWDSKYRVIIFDISETRKLDRDRIRRQFMAWGFARLQNSVWVFPFDCEEYIALLKEKFSFHYDIVYMTVEKIENDGWLREKFDLPVE